MRDHHRQTHQVKARHPKEWAGYMGRKLESRRPMQGDNWRGSFATSAPGQDAAR
jgi:hypothetical protein